VSSLAGTAIAVALVPPVCVMGLLLSADQWSLALGAGLLYLTNLLGILSGYLVVLAKSGPGLRHHMRRSRRCNGSCRPRSRPCWCARP